MGMIYMTLGYGKRCIVKFEKKGLIWFGSGCHAPGGAPSLDSTTPSKEGGECDARRRTS
jgi:hypothetical protein